VFLGHTSFRGGAGDVRGHIMDAKPKMASRNSDGGVRRQGKKEHPQKVTLETRHRGLGGEDNDEKLNLQRYVNSENPGKRFALPGEN